MGGVYNHTIEGQDLVGKTESHQEIKRRYESGESELSEIFDKVDFHIEPTNSFIGANYVRPSLKRQPIKYQTHALGEFEVILKEEYQQMMFLADRIPVLQYYNDLNKTTNLDILVLSDRSPFSTPNYLKLQGFDKLAQLIYEVTQELIVPYKRVHLLDVTIEEAKRRKEKALLGKNFTHDEIFDKLETVEKNQITYNTWTKPKLERDFSVQYIDTTNLEIVQVSDLIEKQIIQDSQKYLES
jgi:thymidylate kinase